MATLNEMIAQGAQFYTPDPVAQYNKMAQMQKYQQENELAKMQMEEYGRARQESNALRQFLPGLNESNRSQLLGFGTTGQGIYKTLAEGDTQQRLRDQAISQTALHKSNILKNAIAQTRDAVAGIDPTDVESYTALRAGVLTQYPELAPHMPAAWNADVKQSLIVTAASVLEGQKPEPGFTLRPGETRFPRGYTGVATAPAAVAAAAKPPEKLEIMRALGYSMDAAGDAAYEAAKRAAPTVAAPPVAIGEMRALGIPETPEGFAYYNELKTKTPVTAPEPTTNEIKNARAIALGAGPEGSPEFNAALRAEVLRMTARPAAAVTAPESTTPQIKNATALARLKGEPGTPAFNKEFVKQMDKSGGGESGGTAMLKAPSGYRVTKSGDLEAIPGGPAAGKPLTALQQQALKKDFAADTSKIKSAVDTADELEKLTDELVGNPDKKIKPHPGLSGITGYAGLLPSLPSGDATKAEQKLETFKGKIKTLGRSLASLDGKLGNMAVQEWKFISDAVQEIRPTAGNLDEQMRDVVRQARLLAKNLRDKFDLTYDETTPATAPSKPAAAALAPADKQALDWANANPKDPRSLQIKQRLGQ